MPVIVPLVSAVNLTPSSTAELSPEATVAGVAKSKMVSAGVTAFDAADAIRVTSVLVVETCTVSVVPLVSPVTVADVADPLETCTGVPAVERKYTRLDSSHRALSFALGSVQLTSARPDAGLAVTPVGADGADGFPEVPDELGWNIGST